jgi:hypothetical protein
VRVTASWWHCRGLQEACDGSTWRQAAAAAAAVVVVAVVGGGGILQAIVVTELLGTTGRRLVRDMRGWEGFARRDRRGRSRDQPHWPWEASRGRPKGGSRRRSSTTQHRDSGQTKEGASKARSGRGKDGTVLGWTDDASCFEWLGRHQCANGSCSLLACKITKERPLWQRPPSRTLHINKPHTTHHKPCTWTVLLQTYPPSSICACLGT